MPYWCEATGLRPWRYRVREEIAFLVDGWRRNATVHGQDGTCLAVWQAWGMVTILPGYAFDGATCAPDIAKLMPAVVLHDLLCQCCQVPGFPMRRAEADLCFFREAEKTAPVLAAIYYAGIRAGGGVHRALTRRAAGDVVTITYYPS